MINKILQINTNLNIKPIFDFPKTKHFIFIDILPRSNNIKNYNKNFYRDLVDLYKINGFKLMEIIEIDNIYHKKILPLGYKLYYFFKKLPEYINPTLLCFFNIKTNQVIKYYISTDINNNINLDIIYEINTCDAIIVDNNTPIVNLLYYIIDMKQFIGYSDTYYTMISKSDINLIKNKFNKYIYIDHITNDILKFNNFENFMTKYIYDITYTLLTEEF